MTESVPEVSGSLVDVIGRAMVQYSPDIMSRLQKIRQEMGSQGHKVTAKVHWVKCGKKCKNCPHGPYLYAFWKQDGKTRSKYIGKVGA